MESLNQDYQVAIIGAGHAGAEAALASARLGVPTVLFTMSLDSVCNLPCNPSIGGTAKGHLVRELDALGGEMGKVADQVTLQSRMLNRGKGPAVHSLRAQVDRVDYQLAMKQVLEGQKNLSLKQAEIVSVQRDNGDFFLLRTALGTVYQVRSAVICTGTYLSGKIFVGDYCQDSGPDGLHPSCALMESLSKLNISTRRFKTGTPARVKRDSIDFDQLEIQYGDEPVIPFSFGTKEPLKNKKECYIAYTNEQTHQIIRESINRSAMYSGNIVGTGARYCPSIEDKVIRFPDRLRHQVFVEPMGLHTQEMYLQGMSTSLPEDVQTLLYRSVKGFEAIEIMRNAYAIEYECIDPTVLNHTLAFKDIPGLYGAGQFNGTSGYEEAAVQGFVAGVNAAHRVQGKDSFSLERSSSYIGTLIDDLVIKGCMDPYRMMTSRSEYRLLLRQDNADQRLTPIGRRLGLIDDERWEMFHVKQFAVQQELKRLEKSSISVSAELNQMLEERNTTGITSSTRQTELLKRPQISYSSLAPFDTVRPVLPDDVVEQVEVTIKYEGYIKKQIAQVKEMQRLEHILLPDDLHYEDFQGIRLEAREKLGRMRPSNIGQASRISGVTPADISVLLIYLEQRRQKRGEGSDHQKTE